MNEYLGLSFNIQLTIFSSDQNSNDSVLNNVPDEVISIIARIQIIFEIIGWKSEIKYQFRIQLQMHRCIQMRASDKSKSVLKNLLHRPCRRFVHLPPLALRAHILIQPILIASPPFIAEKKTKSDICVDTLIGRVCVIFFSLSSSIIEVQWVRVVAEQKKVNFLRINKTHDNFNGEKIQLKHNQCVCLILLVEFAFIG